MPRVQDGAFGASERFAISPGHEAEAYLHLPGGASGHPLSPYYRAGFAAWARGSRCHSCPAEPSTASHFNPQPACRLRRIVRSLEMHRAERRVRPVVGLVLTGGGARSAYQVGVLRALDRTAAARP